MNSQASLTGPAHTPIFTAMPKTLVENKAFPDDQSFTREANMGYPSTTNTLFIQANKDGEFETSDDAFGVERTFLEIYCINFHTVSFNHFIFDFLWNNTELSCAIIDEPSRGKTNNVVSEQV